MFKDLIKEQAGIQLYPILSLAAFVLFFTVLLIMTYMNNKHQMDEMSRLPLDETKPSSENYDQK